MKNLGKWDFIGNNIFCCVKCGALYTQDQFNAIQNYKADSYFPDYCPNCGANMREEAWMPISEKMPPFGYENPVWVTLKPRDDQEFLNDVFVTVCNFYPLENGIIAVFEYNIQGTPVYNFDQVIAWMPYEEPKPYKED